MIDLKPDTVYWYNVSVDSRTSQTFTVRTPPAGSDYALISLTHTWNWTGSPVVALPSGVGSRSGLPVGVSLIGRAGTDWHLLDIGIQLQTALGVPVPG